MIGARFIIPKLAVLQKLFGGKESAWLKKRGKIEIGCYVNAELGVNKTETNLR